MSRPTPTLSRRALLAGGLVVAAAGVLVGPAPRASAATVDPSPGEIGRAQERLNAQGFWCGPVTGKVDELTTCAVLAYQKANGLVVDGILDHGIMWALTKPRPQAHLTTVGKVIEIDLKRQVLRSVDNGKVLLTLHASTGAGAASAFGARQVLDQTPRGRFRIRTSAPGVVENSLGYQHRPHYFLNPYAIYGHAGIADVTKPSTSGGVGVHSAALDLLAGGGHISRGRLVLIA